MMSQQFTRKHICYATSHFNERIFLFFNLNKKAYSLSILFCCNNGLIGHINDYISCISSVCKCLVSAFTELDICHNTYLLLGNTSNQRWIFWKPIVIFGDNSNRSLGIIFHRLPIPIAVSCTANVSINFVLNTHFQKV